MPGTNAGTGQPISFRCSACRKRYSTDEYRDVSTGRHGYRSEVRLTGRVRAKNDGASRGRSTNKLREYECQHCGHVGWSRHKDLEPRT